MSETPSFENLESQTERIVASVFKTFTEFFEDEKFFLVTENDLETNRKFILLEKELANLLVSDNLARYFKGLDKNDPKALEVTNNLRNAILLKINGLFIPGDDFTGRFNQECRHIIEGLMIKNV